MISKTRSFEHTFDSVRADEPGILSSWRLWHCHASCGKDVEKSRPKTLIKAIIVEVFVANRAAAESDRVASDGKQSDNVGRWQKL